MTSEAPIPESFLRALHQSGHAGVIAVTGGGASALGQLLSVPGGSNSILAGVIPYSEPALVDWLGVRPEQFCSPETALAMAVRAFEQARGYKPDPSSQLFGLACTASLASDRPKKGDHRFYLAAQTPNRTILRSLVLDKGTRTRAQEESVVAHALLNLFAEFAGVPERCDPLLHASEIIHAEESVPDPLLAEVWNGRRNFVWVNPQSEFLTDAKPPVGALLCGSFNPLHDAHRELRQVAENVLGVQVGYELSIANVAKPSLDYLTIQHRIGQFSPAYAVLTRAAHFYQKATLFPGLWFVVGMDTAERIVDPRFYDGNPELMHERLTEIKRIGCRVLVAGRLKQDRFETRADLHVPPEFDDLFVELPASKFRRDLSSTELRVRCQTHLERSPLTPAPTPAGSLPKAGCTSETAIHPPSPPAIASPHPPPAPP
ncbi:MAG: CinA family protein [Planctomycetales bacterium]